MELMISELSEEPEGLQVKSVYIQEIAVRHLNGHVPIP